MTMSIHTKHIN